MHSISMKKAWFEREEKSYLAILLRQNADFVGDFRSNDLGNDFAIDYSGHVIEGEYKRGARRYTILWISDRSRDCVVDTAWTWIGFGLAPSAVVLQPPDTWVLLWPFSFIFIFKNFQLKQIIGSVWYGRKIIKCNWY